MGDLSIFATTLITIGALLLAGILSDLLGERTRIPRVTLLIGIGLLVGPSALDLLPAASANWFPLVADMALVMIGFLLGGHLTLKGLRARGGLVIRLSLVVTICTTLVVAAGLAGAGVSLTVALLLGGVAAATDPAATLDVVRESGAEGPFTETLLGTVAIDDAWGITLFSLMLASVGVFGAGANVADPLAHGAWELGGAILLGLMLGVPSAYATGHLRKGEPTLLEAVGVVFLCGGLALWLHVSFLLASIVLGATVANLAKHHTRPFHAIEDVQRPFLVLFFVLAGAALDVGSLPSLGAIGLGYLVLRVLGRILGSVVGARWAGEPARFGHWMGWALLPQAGVALGLALTAVHTVPAIGQELLNVVVATTVLFELIGPFCARRALEKMGEVPA